ncbi:MAG: hypothetical protein VX127_18100 [Myxococcota bacterium]|nr:hypothetical protein [Myxococcota bacterium]
MPILTDCALPPPDPIEMRALRFDGTDLLLDVRYSGGCVDHEYDLCWNSSFGEGVFPEAHLKLGHRSFEDMCDAIIETTIRFDASLIVEAAGDTAFNVRVSTSATEFVTASYSDPAR